MSNTPVLKQEQFRASQQVLADSVQYVTRARGSLDPRLVIVNPAPNASPTAVPSSPTVTLTFPQ